MPGDRTGLERAAHGRGGAPAELSVRQVSRRLGGRLVLDGVSLTVRPGEVVGLLGPNGAGKTTLFRIVMGLLRPHGGEVELDGRSLLGLPTHQRARRGLGYLPQEPSVFTGLSAQDNLRAALELGGRPRHEAEDLIERFGLAHCRRQRARTLSGGERRRLELARLMAGRPRVVLMDEPFKGLDPAARATLGAAVRQMAEHGVGVVVTDHAVQLAVELCERVCLLVDGRQVAEGTGAALAADPIGQQVLFGQGSVNVTGAPGDCPARGLR